MKAVKWYFNMEVGLLRVHFIAMLSIVCYIIIAISENHFNWLCMRPDSYINVQLKCRSGLDNFEMSCVKAFHLPKFTICKCKYPKKSINISQTQ